MKSIHIRDINPDTLEQLKRLARGHHRSLQGELKIILERAARLAPAEPARTIKLHTTRTHGGNSWSREEIYGDSGR